LDFSGTEIIYPVLADVAKKIKKDVKNEVGITASIGIAATKVVAKIASDFQKPDGLTYVPKGKEREFLSSLPIVDLPGIGRKMEEYFHQLGVKTIGEISRIPYEKINVLGKFATHLQEAASGVDNIWFTSRSEVKSVSHSETFAINSSDLKFILAMLQKLAERVGERMREGGYNGRCVYVTIRYFDFRTVSRQRVLFYPTNITREIYEIGETLLEELWDRRVPLRLVGIGISHFAPTTQGLEPKQLVLFESQREKRLELEKRIDYLRERFGGSAIVPATLVFRRRRE